MKSIKPNRLAVRYPTMIPQKIGINLNIPRPNIEARIAESRATSANGQFVGQLDKESDDAILSGDTDVAGATTTDGQAAGQ